MLHNVCRPKIIKQTTYALAHKNGRVFFVSFRFSKTKMKITQFLESDTLLQKQKQIIVIMISIESGIFCCCSCCFRLIACRKMFNGKMSQNPQYEIGNSNRAAGGICAHLSQRDDFLMHANGIVSVLSV